MLQPHRLASLSAAVAATVLVAGSAYGVDYSWSGTTGNWTDAANWGPISGTPAGAADTATFNATGVNAAETIYLNGNQAATSLTFANTSATALSTGISGTPSAGQTLTLTSSLTVNSGAGAVNVGTSATGNLVTVASGNVSLTNNSTSLLTFDAGSSATSTSLQGGAAVNNLTLAGSGNMLFAGSLKGGAGTLSLTMNNTGVVEFVGSGNTFAGGITLNSGTLAIRSVGALGTTTTVTINGGGIAAVGARNIAGTISLAIGSSATFGVGTGTAPDGAGYSNLTFNGAVSFTGAAATINTLNTLVFAGTGAITLPATLNVTGGSNTTTFAAPVTFAGLTTAAVNTSGSTTFAGAMDLGGITPTFNTSTAATITGVITNGGINKTGNSTLVLGNTTRHGNMFAGDTVINNGTLSTVSSYGTSENSRLVLKNGTTFTASNGGNQDIGSLSDGGTANSTAVINTGNVGGDTLSIGWDGTNSTFSGRLRGNNPNYTNNPNAGGGVVKVGTGTLALTGLNEFNGINRVNAGTLQINSIGNGGVATTTSASVAIGATTIPVTSTTGLSVGMIFGLGNATTTSGKITAIDTVNSTVTISAATTVAAAAGATAAVGFGNSLGISDNAASRVVLNTGTLSYTGPAASTDRLFTLTTAGTLDASGTGALNWAGNTTSGANAVALSGTGARTFTLAGTSTAANTFAPILGDNGGATGLTKSGTGTWVLTAPNTHSGGTTVNGGTLVLANTAALGTGGLSVAGGTAQIQASLGSVAIPSLAVTGGALDVTNNVAALTSTDLSTTRGLLATGYNGGTWNGTGILSSTALATNPAAGLAYALASDLGITTVNGSAIPSTSVIIKTAYFGDINLSGKIDADDFALVDRNFAKGTFATGSAAHWTDGDFNYDGILSSADYALLDKSFALQTGSLSPALLAEREAQFGAAYVSSLIASVPEPTTLGLIVAALPFVARRRSR